MSTLLTRRHVISAAGQIGLSGALAVALGSAWPRRADAAIGPLGVLEPPDANGIRLPAGFRSRVIAVSLLPVYSDGAALGYSWHEFPDGGATFPRADGGWIYVSNSESLGELGGGASALSFTPEGSISAAYRILGNTRLNCAGGPTPWGTWLSCEEVAFGFVYECDPTGVQPARKLRALGAFQHEAAAVDPVYRHVYLTEDEPDGCLYRLSPTNYPNLAQGKLQVASVDQASGFITWRTVPLPDPTGIGYLFPLRKQVSSATHFNGGEGIWYRDGVIYFTTKGDSRVWSLDTNTQLLRVIYDAATHPNPVLRGVDNITGAANGKLLVAEDGGDMQLVVLDTSGNATPLLQIDGQSRSEITGPAFNPAGNRLYFSSQRGPFNDGQSAGATYEVSGPFAALLQ